MDKQPNIKVGIMSAPELKVSLMMPYLNKQTDTTSEGMQTFAFADGKIEWNGNRFDALDFVSEHTDAAFEVCDVVIGVNFHWERRENQRFRGKLSIIVEGDKLTLINILPVEEYLKSVISSEMSATANEEFLKAHAVISRSWLLAQIDKNKKLAKKEQEYCSCTLTDDELVRWYDREDHINFDVCADDHCQRYQGITRQTTPTVAAVINATSGIVLVDKDGELCDARFSKCCGGVFEQFENCWEPKHFHYLEARRDSAHAHDFPDLTIEENAREWILGRPEAFCNTSDKEILGQVLNNYDQETTDFYRWSVSYTRAELSELVKRRSGIDFGTIERLEPVERGTSGRLTRLRIVGSKRTMIVGKELEIRRWLSESHLYSSAFVVEQHDNTITLKGAGWGHGVGLCQIGAAVMGANGCGYQQILAHYFPGAELNKLY